MKFKKGTLPTDIPARMKYLYRFQELLRIYHNKKAQDLKDGKITETAFRRFQKNWFEPRNFLLCKEINNCKEQFKEDDTVQVKIEDMEE